MPILGPDATGVGWVYQYALVGTKRSLAELRSLQDWVLRFGLASAEGVAEVASIGGYVKQYTVVVDPHRLRDFGIALARFHGEAKSWHGLARAIRRGAWRT